MKDRGDLRNQLKAVRQRLKMSQQELAVAAGVARQTIGGMEAELYSPSAAVALRLARALGCTVEELFWLESQRETVVAQAAADVPFGSTLNVAVARVGERWVAHSLDGEYAFRTDMIPADGRGTRSLGADVMTIELVDDLEALESTVVVAGCAPGISIWTRSAERWFPGLRVHWIHSNSTESLCRLRRREVHMAGLHLSHADEVSGNQLFIQEVLPGTPVLLINLGVWEEGLLVRSGNPKKLKAVSDLCHSGVKIINREPGSGSRLLLDRMVERSTINSSQITGYSDEVRGHQHVARIVASGSVDAGIGVAAVAASYGLDFVPLCRVRYDLATLPEYMEIEPVPQLLSTLQHRWVRKQLSLLGGFDTSNTGEVTRIE